MSIYGRRVLTRTIVKYVEKKSEEQHKLVDLDKIECCICDGKNFLVKTHCNHFVCLGCFVQLQKPECPMTRQPLENIPDKIKPILPWYQQQQSIEYDSDDSAT
tara:strand:+ start:67 stop:375 length:309 start_codon:yes stop_codon:yes gene_type:complete